MNDKNVIDLSFFTNSLIKASAVKTTNGRMFKGKKTHAKWEQVLRFLIVHSRPPAGDFFARGDEAGRIEVRAMKENSLVRPRWLFARCRKRCVNVAYMVIRFSLILLQEEQNLYWS